MSKEVRVTGYLLEKYGNLAVGTTPLKFDTGGQDFIIVNNSTNKKVFIGSDDTVTTANGFALADNKDMMVRGVIYLRTTEGTADVRYIQASK